MKNNKYKVTYKNGNVREYNALYMELKNGNLYQTIKHYPFDNAIPSVIDGSNIESVECIEDNNHMEAVNE